MSTYSDLKVNLSANLDWNSATVNGKCNAHRFAPEILSKIFIEVVALHERDSIITIPTRPSSEAEDNEFDTGPLLTLSHVCWYWREVAVRNPALWRRIHGRCHDQMRIFLERSRSLTITLFLAVVHWSAPEDAPMPPPMESVIRTHAPRLHRLDLWMVPAWQNVTLLFESLHARHLEVLTITSSCMYHTSIAGPVMAQDLLLNGETSSLKALAIMPIVNWIPTDTPFPRLTHLFISFDAGPGLGHPFDVLNILSNTPVLSFLHVDLLVYDGPHSPGSWHPPSDGVLLHQLRSLVFTTSSYYLVYSVLSRLVLPGDIFIRLQGMIHDFDSQGYPAPLPPLALRPVTFLDISTDREQIRMVADGPTSGVWLDGLYEASDEPDACGWETWLLRLPESIVLSHITHLHVHLAPLSVFLPGLLKHLPEVSHLAVVFGEPTLSNATDTDFPPVQLQNVSFPMSVLSLALSPSTTPMPATNDSDSTAVALRPSVRCPALQTLFFEWQETVTHESAAAFLGFAAMLTERARAGFPIRRVVLQAARRQLLEDIGGVTALDIFRSFESDFSANGTEYEIVEREEGATGMCSFKMRSVWKVEGEEKYWEVGGYEKPGYAVRIRHNW